MATPALTFVIVGHDDHPIFEADLLQRPEGYAERWACWHTTGC